MLDSCFPSHTLREIGGIIISSSPRFGPGPIGFGPPSSQVSAVYLGFNSLIYLSDIVDHSFPNRQLRSTSLPPSSLILGLGRHYHVYLQLPLLTCYSFEGARCAMGLEMTRDYICGLFCASW